MPTETLPKKMIITHREMIEKLFKSGRKVSGRFVYFLYLPMEASEDIPMQVGFMCGKKTGNAVTRNYYKRVFREVFRKNKSYFTGYRTLIISQQPILHSDFSSLEEDIVLTAKKMK